VAIDNEFKNLQAQVMVGNQWMAGSLLNLSAPREA
jgi:hypothetical protein